MALVLFAQALSKLGHPFSECDGGTLEVKLSGDINVEYPALCMQAMDGKIQMHVWLQPLYLRVPRLDKFLKDLNSRFEGAAEAGFYHKMHRFYLSAELEASEAMLRLKAFIDCCDMAYPLCGYVAQCGVWSEELLDLGCASPSSMCRA